MGYLAKWFAAAGALLLLLGLWLATETMSLEQRSAGATATVTRIEHDYSNDSESTHYHIEFRTLEGTFIRTELGKKPLQKAGAPSFVDFSIRFPVFHWLKRGDTLQIIYDRADPRYALPADTHWLLPQGLIGVGMLFLLCAGTCMVTRSPIQSMGTGP